MSHFPDQHEDHQTTPLPFCAPYHQHHKHARHESQTLPLEFHYTESHSDQRSSLSSSSSLSSTTRTPAKQQRQQHQQPPTASEHHVTSSSCLSPPPPPAPLPIIITTTTPTTMKTISPSNYPVELSTTTTKTPMTSITPERRKFSLQKRSRIKWWIFFFIVTATCLTILVVGIYVGLRQRG